MEYSYTHIQANMTMEHPTFIDGFPEINLKKRDFPASQFDDTGGYPNG